MNLSAHSTSRLLMAFLMLAAGALTAAPTAAVVRADNDDVSAGTADQPSPSLDGSDPSTDVIAPAPEVPSVTGTSGASTPPTTLGLRPLPLSPIVAGLPTQQIYFFHPPQDGTPTNVMATRTSALILTQGDEAYRDQLKAAGFSGPSLQYITADETSGPVGIRTNADGCGTYPHYPADLSGMAGDFCTALNGVESNFLHNGQGQRLYSAASWQEGGRTVSVAFYVMNPAAPAWRAYFAAHTKQVLATYGYNGLFMDNLDLSLNRAQNQEDNSDGVVQEYTSTQAYQQAVVGQLQLMRQSLGTGPNTLVWANMTSGSDSATNWDGYLPYLDGSMDEYFVDRWNNTYSDPSAWQAQLDRVDELVQSGKSFIGIAKGTQADAARMRFALGSYLLVTGPGAYFRYASENAYSQDWQYPDYQDKLGNPTGPRYQTPDGQWARNFTCGSVTVNVTAHTASIQPDPTRAGCS